MVRSGFPQRGGFQSRSRGNFRGHRGLSNLRKPKIASSFNKFSMRRSSRPFMNNNRWNNNNNNNNSMSSGRNMSSSRGANLALRRRGGFKRGGGFVSTRGSNRPFNRNMPPQNRNPNFNNRREFSGRSRGRGMRWRGRGRRGNFNRNSADQSVTSLDAQLDSYMGDDVMKTRLDQDLDAYFSNTTEVDQTNSSNAMQGTMDVSMDGAL